MRATRAKLKLHRVQPDQVKASSNDTETRDTPPTPARDGRHKQPDDHRHKRAGKRKPSLAKAHWRYWKRSLPTAKQHAEEVAKGQAEPSVRDCSRRYRKPRYRKPTHTTTTRHTEDDAKGHAEHSVDNRNLFLFNKGNALGQHAGQSQRPRHRASASHRSWRSHTVQDGRNKCRQHS